jgi:hypothetical protein
LVDEKGMIRFAKGITEKESKELLDKIPISQERMDDIKCLIDDLGMSNADFFKGAKIKSFEDITINNIDKIEDALWTKKKS